ncbi:MAG TPA: CDP-glucose 4,6-dehydratase [Sphingomicrobium sp.]|nr:CDP-glucose 4,6-dehydratase [Sphingomicrobium sp.]
MEDLGLNQDFWRGRRVVLTGHTGFKGSWLVLLLESLGARITGISLPPTPGSLFEQIDGQERCSHNICDIRDFDSTRDIIASAEPAIIFHLAAQPLVRQSYRDPLETIGTNVLGTANVLEAARGVERLQAIVSVTTDKCYVNDGRRSGYVETDRLGGHDPYSNSKACAELITQCFRDSFFKARGIGVASARAGNVIGGGDYASDRLIPDVVRALGSGQRPELRNPTSVRPWQHVLEPLHGYCLLAEKLTGDARSFAKGWNFGPSQDDTASVATVVDQLARHWGGSGKFGPQHGDHPHEAEVLNLDSGMAMRELGWKSRLPLKTAVEWTADWYRARSGGADAAQLCTDQIRRFSAMHAVEAAA